MNLYQTRTLLTLFLSLLLAGCGQHTGNDYQKPAQSETAPVQWQAPLTLATGNAHVGRWQMNESEFHYVDDASVALGDDGSAAMVWVDNEQQDVFFQYYDDQDRARFSSPVNVSRSPGTFSWLPRVRVAGPDQVYVLWQEIIFSGGSHGGEILFSYSTDGGENFSAPVNLSQTDNGAGKGRLTEDNWDNGSLDFTLGLDGNIYVAWTEYEGPLRFRRSVDGGESFENAIHVSGDASEPARGPSIAQGPDGGVHLAWTVGDDPAANIHIASSRDNGQRFEAARPVYPSDGHSDTPSLTLDTNGHLHLVYAEGLDGPTGQGHIIYMQLDNAGEVVVEPGIISIHPADEESARAPNIELDMDGRIYVIWEHHPHEGGRAQGLGFTMSTDGGETFTEPEVIPGSADNAGINGSLQGQLGDKLAVHPDGSLAIANSHFRLGEGSRILMIRGQPVSRD